MIDFILIAFGLAMDAFGVSVTLGGIYHRKVFTQGLLSSLVFGVFQAVMPVIGWIIGGSFRSVISGVDHWIAFILLLTIGLKMINGDIYQRQKFLNRQNIGLKLILSLAVATSIDALIVGLGLAFLNISILLTVGIIGIITFMMSLTGIFIGAKCRNLLPDKIGAIGGLMLITIGIKTLFDHMLF